MWNKTRLIILAVVAVMLLTAGCSHRAVTNEAKSEDKPELVIGAEFYEPFFYMDDDGKINGLDAEIIEEACQRIGYVPRFKIIRWENKDAALKSREIDVIWSCFPMTDRESEYLWAGPYLYDRQILMVDSDSGKTKLSQLAGCRIGVQIATQSETRLLSGGANIPQGIQVISFDTLDEAVAALREGAVDAVASHESSLLHYTQNEPDRFYELPQEIRKVCLGAAFAKDGNKILAKALQQTLLDMLADGTTAEIVARHGMDPERFAREGGI